MKKIPKKYEILKEGKHYEDNGGMEEHFTLKKLFFDKGKWNCLIEFDKPIPYTKEDNGLIKFNANFLIEEWKIK